MKRVKEKIKKVPKWCIGVLILVCIITLNMHITSVVTHNVITEKMENANEMVITDEVSFIDLQVYFTHRYKANGSAIYLLQPKSYVKLYKQCVNTYVVNDSVILNVPVKVSLLDESKFQLALKKNEYVRISENSDYENKLLVTANHFKTAYIFPIYHYRTHVSEFVIFFDNDITLSNDKIIEITSELQALARLIK